MVTSYTPSPLASAGDYVTGGVTEAFLRRQDELRNDAEKIRRVSAMRHEPADLELEAWR